MSRQLRKRFASAILSATFIAVMATSADARSGRVTDAVLKPDHPTYNGPCPLTIHFSGYIKADGPTDAKYVFTRSDGATMEPVVLSFARAGVQRVETTWTLGDARELPRYAGWQAIKTLAPNETESNHAAGAFRLVCGKSNGQPPSGQPQPGQTPPNQAPPGQPRVNTRAESVEPFLSRLAAQRKQQFDKELASLKSLSDRYAPALVEALKKLGFDADAMRADFRAAAQARDPAERRQRMAQLAAKYKPQLMALAQSAGVNPAALRQQIVAALNHPNLRFREGELGVLQVDGDPGAPPPPPPAPDATEQVLSAPFTGVGKHVGYDRDGYADAATGLLFSLNGVSFAGSVQDLVFITQELPVETGVRRVRVSATLDPVSYNLIAVCFVGYASGEAIVNLHVMEGSREVCSDRLSLYHFTSAVVGYGTPTGTTPVQLQCEFTRANPDDASSYNLVAELESWAGGGGGISISVDMEGHLQHFHVYQYRH